MSSESAPDRIAVVRDAVAAINRGDWQSALARTTLDFAYDISRTASPLRGVHARDEMERLFTEFLGAWESVRYDLGRPVEVPGGIVTPFTTRFRGREGIEVDAEATWLWTFRDGLIARLTLFQETDEALEAAGMRG